MFIWWIIVKFFAFCQYIIYAQSVLDIRSDVKQTSVIRARGAGRSRHQPRVGQHMQHTRSELDCKWCGATETGPFVSSCKCMKHSIQNEIIFTILLWTIMLHLAPLNLLILECLLCRGFCVCAFTLYCSLLFTEISYGRWVKICIRYNLSLWCLHQFELCGQEKSDLGKVIQRL